MSRIEKFWLIISDDFGKPRMDFHKEYAVKC